MGTKRRTERLLIPMPLGSRTVIDEDWLQGIERVMGAGASQHVMGAGASQHVMGAGASQHVMRAGASQHVNSDVMGAGACVLRGEFVMCPLRVHIWLGGVPLLSVGFRKHEDLTFLHSPVAQQSGPSKQWQKAHF
jgi:hypothetical protein